MINEKKGLIVVNTGDGKGKTTAALGMVLRSLGYGHKVAVVQFAKGNWTTGEKLFIEQLKAFESLNSLLIWHSGAVKTGAWLKDNTLEDNQKLAQDIFQIAKNILEENNDLQLLVLDEFNIAMANGYLSVAEIIEFLEKCKNSNIDVVLTGRNAPEDLMKYADTVTIMTEYKHAFKNGINAKKGIDY